MRMRHVPLALTLVIAALSTAPKVGAALPCPDGVGLLGSADLTAGVCVPDGDSASTTRGDETVPDAEVSSGGASESSPYAWARNYFDTSDGGGRCFGFADGSGGVTVAGSTYVPGPNEEVGRYYADTLTDTRTGEVVSTTNGCEIPGDAAGVDVGEAPPPPPTSGEVIADAPLPKLPFVLSPVGRNCSPASASAGPANPAPRCAAGEAPGLTGLETLLWIDPPPPPEVSVTVAIRGYTVTTRAHPVRYRWDMRQPGDTESTRNPDPSFTTTGPGTRDAPAARYRWETKGDYHIALAVVWEGSYTFSGFGVSRTEPLGPVTGEATVVPYHVIEIRGAPAEA
jgi:hypothetical protein